MEQDCQGDGRAEIATHFRALRVLLRLPRLADATAQLVAALSRLSASGGLVLLAGNGGSAATAAHAAVDLSKCGLRALALTESGPMLTMLANDYEPAQVFARQVVRLGRPDDVLVLLSVSGRSPNVLQAAAAARGSGLRVVALTGGTADRTAPPLAALADLVVVVPSDDYGIVEDLHGAILHATAASLRGRDALDC